MKLFEDFLYNNSELLDNFEPESGHFERFENKMKLYEIKRKKSKFKVILMAAIFLIPISITCILALYNNNYTIENKSNKNIAFNNISTEYSEIEFYFENKIEKKMNEFNQLQCFVNESEKLRILNDLKEIDNSIINLNIELQNTSNNIKIINAIITNYQFKDKLLDRVITQIKENC